MNNTLNQLIINFPLGSYAKTPAGNIGEVVQYYFDRNGIVLYFCDIMHEEEFPAARLTALPPIAPPL